jgi:hypothetical protein
MDMKKFAFYLLAIIFSASFFFAPHFAEAQQQKTQKYSVTGQAKVWEASYSFRIRSAKKELVKGYGTASKGAPEWGDFKELIKVANEKDLTLELFEVSQEDGKEINKLIIPLDQIKGKVYYNKAFRDVKVTLKQ